MNSLTVRLIIAMILALILTILPLPDLFLGLRPPWVLLLILYLQYFLPDCFHVSVLVIVGLVLDVLLATVIGEHAFALSFVSWLASNKARRFSFFSMGQQMGLIGFFCLLYQVLIATIDAFLGFHVGFFMPLGSALLSLLLWPWVILMAQDTLLTKDAKSTGYSF